MEKRIKGGGGGVNRVFRDFRIPVHRALYPMHDMELGGERDCCCLEGHERSSKSSWKVIFSKQRSKMTTELDTGQDNPNHTTAF